MFGYKKESNLQFPGVTRSTITPNNYGRSHLVIDDDSRLFLELQNKGYIPTQEIADKIESCAQKRTQDLALWKKIRKNLTSLSDCNQEINKIATETKLVIARNSQKQYESNQRLLANMEKIDTDYSLSNLRRTDKHNQLMEKYKQLAGNLRG
ncbi:hypothetical protein VV11_002315 [Trichodesmium erythraeum 21-75]|nr:hypothetical protein [Trichodesmium erythraeum 21-75]